MRIVLFRPLTELGYLRSARFTFHSLRLSPTLGACPHAEKTRRTQETCCLPLSEALFAGDWPSKDLDVISGRTGVVKYQ